jgi:hypothetical protein
MRGAIITGLGCGWRSRSRAYGEPDLALLVPVASLTLLFQGMTSTNFYSHQREIALASCR